MGEWHDRLPGDPPRLHRRLERVLDEAQAAALAQISPRFPTQHGWRVEEADPLDLGLRADLEELPRARSQELERVSARLDGCGSRDSARNLRLDDLHDRRE